MQIHDLALASLSDKMVLAKSSIKYWLNDMHNWKIKRDFSKSDLTVEVWARFLRI